MTRRIYLLSFFLLLFVWGVVAQRGRVEAVEIGKHNTDLLPKGKEADGIVGDFILRNNRVHALISGVQPTRRANMRTENNFVTQGCIYDLDLRGEDNDQITAFRPGDFGGEVSWVKVAKDGSDGVGVVEVVRTAEKGEGLFMRHEYRLEHDWQYLLVISTYRNESQAAKKVTPRAVWRGFEDSREWQVENIQVADSTDPFDKRGYAWGEAPGGALMEPEVMLRPGEEKVYRTALAVADSPLAAYGLVAGLSTESGEISGSARDPSGAPAIRGTLIVPVGGQPLPHYPDAKGQFSFRVPAGSYQLTFEDIGRDSIERSLNVKAKSKTALDLAVSTASVVRGEIRDESGNYSPGKVQFIGVDGTETPDFGTGYRAHGGSHQYQTHD
jgi:hypothetical protein